mgnify:CR=1 FL=1
MWQSRNGKTKWEVGNRLFVICFQLIYIRSGRFFENYRKGLQKISYKISKTSDVFRFSSYFLNCFLPQNSYKSPYFCASLSFFFAMNFVSAWNWVVNANLECKRYLPSLLFQFNFIRFLSVSRLNFSMSLSYYPKSVIRALSDFDWRLSRSAITV